MRQHSPQERRREVEASQRRLVQDEFTDARTVLPVPLAIVGG
ncbi:hypothetical protein [Kitasatospora sp. NPDC101183]